MTTAATLGAGVIYVMGGAGTGKTTMVRKAAPDIGAAWYDTGCWYRALALVAVRQQLDLEAEDASEQLMTLFSELDLQVEGETVLVQGEDVSGQIHGREVTAVVSRVAGFGPVRMAIAQHQREVIGDARPVILIGRSPREPYAEPQLVVRVHKELHEAASHRALQLPGTTHEDLERRNQHDRDNMVRLGLHTDGVEFDARGLDPNQQAAAFLQILAAEGFSESS